MKRLPIVNCTVVQPCGYLTEGHSYRIEDPRAVSRTASIRFWNEQRQAGTYISAGMVLAYVRLGKLALA